MQTTLVAFALFAAAAIIVCVVLSVALNRATPACVTPTPAAAIAYHTAPDAAETATLASLEALKL